MSKTAFVEQIASKGKISKAEAKRMMELVLGEIEMSLKRAKKNGGKVTIGTLGTFTVAKRAARMGRNPQTGEAIKIKASKKLRFRPAMNLKRAAGCAKARAA
jgi:DNA-binding protein HU-beta